MPPNTMSTIASRASETAANIPTRICWALATMGGSGSRRGGRRGGGLGGERAGGGGIDVGGVGDAMEEAVDLGHIARGQLVDRAFGLDAAVREHHRAVSDRADALELVGDDDEGEAERGAELEQGLVDAGGDHRIEAGRR